jgi:hypothetical protein
MATDELFNTKKSHVIIKNFIDKDIAIKIRDFFTYEKSKLHHDILLHGIVLEVTK